jgi:hypothetical protein
MTEFPTEPFKAYLTEMLRRAEGSPASSETLQARMWQHFLPAALSLYTTAGVLEQIAAAIAEPSADEEDDEEAA